MNNDAAVIAGQLQDVASSLDAIARAVVERPAAQVHVEVPAVPTEVTVQAPPQEAPVVNVTIPPLSVPAVNVAAPNVLVRPEINIPAAKAVAYEISIVERDADGYMKLIRITPV